MKARKWISWGISREELERSCPVMDNNTMNTSYIQHLIIRVRLIVKRGEGHTRVRLSTRHRKRKKVAKGRSPLDKNTMGLV